MSVSMYHNPKCSKSMATLTLLQEKGIAPELILYLETAPSVAALMKKLSAIARCRASLG
ncbi:MAG TPA: hypothetical protein VMV88_10790 [Gallionella sp.]|nr:hypothetical protein [Gallionella sp.]